MGKDPGEIHGLFLIDVSFLFYFNLNMTTTSTVIVSKPTCTPINGRVEEFYPIEIVRGRPSLIPSVVRRKHRSAAPSRRTIVYSPRSNSELTRMIPGDSFRIRMAVKANASADEVITKFNQMESGIYSMIYHYRRSRQVSADFTLSSMVILPTVEKPFYTFVAYRIDSTSHDLGPKLRGG